MLTLSDDAIKQRIIHFFESYHKQFGQSIDLDAVRTILETELQKKQIDYVVKYLTDVDGETLVKTLSLLNTYKKAPVEKLKPQGPTTTLAESSTKKKAKKKVSKNTKKQKQ